MPPIIDHKYDDMKCDGKVYWELILVVSIKGDKGGFANIKSEPQTNFWKKKMFKFI